jgi:hypothetical protein
MSYKFKKIKYFYINNSHDIGNYKFIELFKLIKITQFKFKIINCLYKII